jgi:phosphatidylserine/phosphatidylglycerophosphate/cardiolipin synthase-like enzyme
VKAVRIPEKRTPARTVSRSRSPGWMPYVGTAVVREYARLLDGARDRAVLLMAYFIPDEPLLRPLLAAARRGVRIMEAAVIMEDRALAEDIEAGFRKCLASSRTITHEEWAARARTRKVGEWLAYRMVRR